MKTYDFHLVLGSRTVEGSGFDTKNERDRACALALYVAGWEPAKWWEMSRWFEDTVPEPALIKFHEIKLETITNA